MGVFLSTKSTYTPSNMQEYYELYRDPVELASLQGQIQNTKQSNKEFQTLLEDTAKLDAYIKGLKEGDDMKRAYNDFNIALNAAADDFYKDGFNDKTASKLRNLRVEYQKLIPAISKAFDQYDTAQKNLAQYLNDRIYYENNGELTPYDVQASDYFGGKTPQFNNYISKKEAEADAAKMASRYFQTVYSKGKAPDIEGFDKLDWLKTTHGVKPRITELENWVNSDSNLKAIKALFDEKYKYNSLSPKQQQELNNLFYNGIVEGLHYNETQTYLSKGSVNSENDDSNSNSKNIINPEDIQYEDGPDQHAYVIENNGMKRYVINARTNARIKKGDDLSNIALAEDRDTKAYTPDDDVNKVVSFTGTERELFSPDQLINLSTTNKQPDKAVPKAPELINLIINSAIRIADDEEGNSNTYIPTFEHGKRHERQNKSQFRLTWSSENNINPNYDDTLFLYSFDRNDDAKVNGTNVDSFFRNKRVMNDSRINDSLINILNIGKDNPTRDVIAFVRGGDQSWDRNNTRNLILYNAEAFMKELDRKLSELANESETSNSKQVLVHLKNSILDMYWKRWYNNLSDKNSTRYSMAKEYKEQFDANQIGTVPLG